MIDPLWLLKELQSVPKTLDSPGRSFPPTNRTGENRTGEPRPLDWTLSWALPWTPFVGRFVGAFVGVLEGLTTGKSTLVGPVVGALVGDLVGALVGPLIVPLVDPLVGRGSLSPALCVAHLCLIFSPERTLSLSGRKPRKA